MQYHYIAANLNPVGKKLLLGNPGDASAYSRVHARYHPIFRNMVEKYGYYELFLVLVGSAIVLAAVWGADLAGLATGLGVSSIVIGLALQDTLGSVMSGIALLQL